MTTEHTDPASRTAPETVARLRPQGDHDRDTIDALERQATVDHHIIAGLREQGGHDRDTIVGLERQATVDHENIAELARQGGHDREQIRQLETALVTARQIGAAMGILMAADHLDETGAFDALRTVSQRTNRKLRDIAADVVYTGTLAGISQNSSEGVDTATA